MAGWRDIHIGPEGDRLKIGGVEIWRSEWRWVNAQTIYLPHPFDVSQHFSFMVCEAGSRRAPVRFAAGRLPGGMWAFYVPADSNATRQ